MATLQQAKSALRKEIKRRLVNLSSEEKRKQSDIVVNKVLSSSWYRESQRLSLFLSMPDEIETFPILKAALTAGKECFIPYYKGQHMSMVKLSSLEEYDKLPLTRWNIKQPPDDHNLPDALETGGLDLIFIPGLAFTQQGARLGRGKGYYDSFLAKCRKGHGRLPRTVALIFHQQLVDFVPVGEHDMLVQEVLCALPEEL